MIGLFKNILRKKPKPILVLDTTSIRERESVHIFNSELKSDTNYCAIIQEIQDPKNSHDIIKVKLAWRLNREVRKGDLFIIKNRDQQKTYRILDINSDDIDIKTGIACCLP